MRHVITAMEKNYILWLSYFDCELTRKYGRRLSRHLCVENPKSSEFLEACKSLGVECEYQDKKYPRAWYKGYGYIVAKGTKINKYELMKMLAKEVKDLRNKMIKKL